MKAYVIKNKEDKYSDRDFYFTPYFDCDVKFYNYPEEAEMDIKLHNLRDCKVIPILIAEGDLEKQLAEKDKRIAELEDKDWYEGTIEQLEEQNGKLIKERDDNAQHTEQLLQENAQLKKEIEELKEQAEIWHKLFFEKMETQIVGVTNEKLKEIRHQVCEEIREFIHTKEYDQFGLEYLMNGSAVLEKLDQIEQGESDGTRNSKNV